MKSKDMNLFTNNPEMKKMTKESYSDKEQKNLFTYYQQQAGNQMKNHVPSKTQELEAVHRMNNDWFQASSPFPLSSQMVWDVRHKCYTEIPVQQCPPPSFLSSWPQPYTCPEEFLVNQQAFLSSNQEDQENLTSNSPITLASTALPLVDYFGGVIMEFVDTLYTSSLVRYVCDKTRPSPNREAAEILAKSNLNPNAKEFTPEMKEGFGETIHFKTKDIGVSQAAEEMVSETTNAVEEVLCGHGFKEEDIIDKEEVNFNEIGKSESIQMIPEELQVTEKQLSQLFTPCEDIGQEREFIPEETNPSGRLQQHDLVPIDDDELNTCEGDEVVEQMCSSGDNSNCDINEMISSDNDWDEVHDEDWWDSDEEPCTPSQEIDPTEFQDLFQCGLLVSNLPLSSLPTNPCKISIICKPSLERATSPETSSSFTSVACIMLASNPDKACTRLDRVNRIYNDIFPDEGVKASKVVVKFSDNIEVIEEPEDMVDDLAKARISDFKQRMADKERKEKLLAPVFTKIHRQKMFRKIYGENL